MPPNQKMKNQQKEYFKEILRKMFHLTMLIFPITYLYVSKKEILSIIIPLAIIVVGVDFIRHKIQFVKKIFTNYFGKIMRQAENNSLTGASYFFIAACSCTLIFEKIIILNAFTILAISDSLASLIGKKIKSQPFLEKSFAGSLAFFISSMAIIVFYGGLFDQKLAYYLFATLAVFITTVIEARPSLFKVDDNLTIPVSFSVTMFLFSLIWSYNY